MKDNRTGMVRKHLHGLYMKMVSQGGTPEYAARGVAIGLFLGFFIPMGLQLLIAIPLAFLLRASKVLAATFTFVTNHFTIFIIYPVQCVVGSYLLMSPLSYSGVGDRLGGIFKAGSPGEWWSEMVKMGTELAGAFLAGGFLFGAIAAAVGYFVTLRLVAAYRRHRGRRKRKNQDFADNPANLK